MRNRLAAYLNFADNGLKMKCLSDVSSYTVRTMIMGMNERPANRLGARVDDSGRTHFVVWAPRRERVQVHLLGDPPRLLDMARDERGYHSLVVDDAPPGTRYFYRIERDLDRPDPASRLQPEGVHGPSQVVDHRAAYFQWTDQQWSNPPLSQHVIYELHVGTFTPQGTFDAIIERLDDLADLGVTAIELMPIAEFPGDRNWGYDGVSLFAAHHAYGGPDALKRLVNACHGRGLAVFLDVVYNHLGPEGNYLADFGPYFTDSYRTPWGAALNFDDAYSDEIRRFFIENALYWVDDCHIDGLRLDAVHAIRDHTATTFLEELATAVHAAAQNASRRIHMMAESSDNDPRLVQPSELNGIGMDATWNDDFHHALRTLLADDREGYYADYGSIGDLAKSMTQGFVYTGEYSKYRKRRHGRAPDELPGSSFIVCAQNHDQVGNRMHGDRLAETAGLDGCRIAATLTLLSPFVPLLFMGEEYAEIAPFQYFVSHGDPQLIEAVRKGRREEFAAFKWAGEPPDPQALQTFERSRLNWSLRDREPHSRMLAFYRRLLELRRESRALASRDLSDVDARTHPDAKAILIRRRADDAAVMILANFEYKPIEFPVSDDRGRWQMVIDSTDARWGGDGPHGATTLGPERASAPVPPRSAIVYTREDSSHG